MIDWLIDWLIEINFKLIWLFITVKQQNIEGMEDKHQNCQIQQKKLLWINQKQKQKTVE